ncbi:hypothetical protein [Shewanella pealeana]|uniref:Uncharacterized protein n=1 Tax=Shewanella pealeana (strain ATCC 700345 / ANG-SQ1) TaxID=398579 RepID=A8H9Q7_SHEPA|nr:hypothetical protein [Shewanella pealeana]ABV89294.1 conserved hypothetical protein [Shewanella pealeana ATCC 700345]
MRKQIAYLVFFIALVGQFILSPAMAMPKYLHASSHAEQHIEPQASHLQTLLTDSFASSLGADEQMNCDSEMPNLSLVKIDCDALCDILGAGNCVSHCVSAPGIIEQHQLSLNYLNSTASVQTSFWSPQTVELSSANPPPISI